jgi:hypothetical protein
MALDPRQSRLKRERQKSREQIAESLGPAFPDNRVSFDPFFFGLESEPAEPKKSSFPEPL